MPTTHVTSRHRLHLTDIADRLSRSKKIIVITGAGISTNCGIPVCTLCKVCTRKLYTNICKDFRSEGGLYSLIQAKYDAALLNPPWQHSHDIDDRPKKRRKASERYFYETVAADGTVIGPVLPETIVADPPIESYELPELPRRSESRRSKRFKPPIQESIRENTSEPASGSSSIGELPSDQLLKESAEFAAAHQALTNSEETRQLKRRRRPPRSPVPTSSSEDALISKHDSSRRDTASTVVVAGLADTIATVASAKPDRSDLASDPLSIVLDPVPSLSRQSSLSRSSSRRSVRSRSTIASDPSQGTTISRSPSVGHKNPESKSRSVPQVVIPAYHPSSAETYVAPNPRRSAIQREASSMLSSSDSDEPSSSQSSSRSSLPNLKGKDLFDSIIWKDPYSTSIFYMFITSFRQRLQNDIKHTTETHKFIRALRDSGRLVRTYTQNIDSLEAREGLSTDLSLGPGNRARFQAKNQFSKPDATDPDSPHDRGVECVLLHGSLERLRCGKCDKLTSWDEAREEVTSSGQAPDCPSCIEYNEHRTGRGRRGLDIGRLRPDIVLYGEEHPEATLIAPIVTHDLALNPDSLLILGTSLRVHGLKVIVKEMAKAVHAKGGKVVFINQTKPAESTWADVIDYWVEMDCDNWVLDLKSRQGELWLPQGETDSQGGVPVVRGPSKEKKRPAAIRDEKHNSIYLTFKILDTLKKFRDTRGNQSPRSTYWQEKPHRASTGQIDTKSDKKPQTKMRQSMSAVATKTPPKFKLFSTAARKAAADAQKRRTEIDGKIGQVPGAWLAESIWKDLQTQSGGQLTDRDFGELKKRVPLRDLAATVPSNSRGYQRSFDPNDPNNHCPIVPAGNKDRVPEMSLESHPPSGYELPKKQEARRDRLRVQTKEAKLDEADRQADLPEDVSGSQDTNVGNGVEEEGPKTTRMSTRLSGRRDAKMSIGAVLDD